MSDARAQACTCEYLGEELPGIYRCPDCAQWWRWDPDARRIVKTDRQEPEKESNEPA